MVVKIKLTEKGKLLVETWRKGDEGQYRKLIGLAGDATGATVRRVLCHTAGLPLHYRFFYENEGGPPPSTQPSP